MSEQKGQMALDISIRDSVSFASFVTGHNRELVHQLREIAQGNKLQSTLLIWGESGGGKSHLLNACFRLAEKNDRKAWFVALADLAEEAGSEAILDGLEDHDLYLVDGLDWVAGKAGWEERLFQLCNYSRDNDKSLIISATRPPTSLDISLRDLLTRLMSGLTYQVLPLSDEQKITALQERAHDRGFALSDDAVKYMLNRYRRETGNLFRMLEEIDRASLEQKRLITIPFLRSLNFD